jgi:hypothetical protein
MRVPPIPLAAGFVLAASLLVISGCAGHEAPAAPSAVPNGACPPGQIAGSIGGQSKCLQEGQDCSQRYAVAYRQYGFICTRVNGRHALKSVGQVKPKTHS